MAVFEPGCLELPGDCLEFGAVTLSRRQDCHIVVGVRSLWNAMHRRALAHISRL